MTMLVRDAADLLEDNIRFHAAQGVDLFVVADHESQDGSLEILRRYESSGLVDLRQVTGPAEQIWAEERTRLARRADELGADWVIHDDQDEFWWSLVGTLKDAFGSIPDQYGLVVAPRTEFVPRPGGGPFAERLIYRERRFVHPPKAAHRAHPGVVLDQAHPTRIALEQGYDFEAFHGRPGLDASVEGASADDLGLLFAPTFPVRILHFPLRSFEQYRGRVETAVRDGQLSTSRRDLVRRAYEEDTLDELYGRLLYSQRIAARVAEGSLVEDTEFRDYLAACPDPLEGGPVPPGAAAWSADRRRRELEELSVDAMYAITRYVRRRATREDAKAARERRSSRLAGAHRRRLRKLRRIRHSLWWRMRPRVPRAFRRPAPH